MRRTFALVVAVLTISTAGGAWGDGNERLPVPEPNFAATLIPQPCTADPGNPYEAAQYLSEGWTANSDGLVERYPGACQRLRFTFGPITVKPGQNDTLIQPITVEKPAYDGYLVRFKPDLIYANGTAPPVDVVHLHHGTWIQLTDSIGRQVGPVDFRKYGSGSAFFASGEEKTIGDIPRGFGFPVKGTDRWELLHMVHSTVSEPKVVWITYDVDYIAKDVGDSEGFRTAFGKNLIEVYPIWLDVRPSFYPVFNVFRSLPGRTYGSGGECTWPAQECAALDPWGKISLGQGQAGNGTGKDWKIPADGGLGRMDPFDGGTLIGLGGHVHPGGLTTQVDLVRKNAAGADLKVRRIHTSDAWYWSRQTPADPDGLQNLPRTLDRDLYTSWDFSMTVTGFPRWAVDIHPGDYLRINATYENTVQATYENMGIIVAYVAPFVNGASQIPGAIDPMSASFDPATQFDGRELSLATVQADIDACLGSGVLCDHGLPTHGSLSESRNFGGTGELPITAVPKDLGSTVHIAGFSYSPGNLGAVNATGIPRVPFGGSLTFVNEDMGANVYHTVTACRWPCSGATGTAYPLANGRSTAGYDIDFDSGELGFGLTTGPAKQAIDWKLAITSANAFPNQSAGYTYFCRIHPSMRGAFWVAAT